MEWYCPLHFVILGEKVLNPAGTASCQGPGCTQTFNLATGKGTNVLAPPGHEAWAGIGGFLASTDMWPATQWICGDCKGFDYIKGNFYLTINHIYQRYCLHCGLFPDANALRYVGFVP